MTSSEPLETEFVEADIQQLQDELAAEFAQLLERLQNR
jgi:succinate dehydrogenase flavin-adding protein (antitoxin of CptAB toxin-antitoxin module)